MEIIVNVAILCTLYFLVNGQLDKNKYGPYTVVFTQFKKCKGPKLYDCGAYEIANTNNMSDVIFKFNYDNDCSVSSAKITVSALQDNNRMKKLFNYALDKPCQHFVLGPILINSFNLTNSCKIKKGKYDIHLNMMNQSATFLGPNFFYGTYNYKVMVMNKMKNFICADAFINVEKKKL